MPDEDCPQDEGFREWLAGRLPVEAAETLFAHMDSCPRCQAKLQTVSDVEDTLINCLRQPWVRDELQYEPQFREAVARARAVGDTFSTCDQEGGKEGPKPDVLGQLGEYEILEKLAEGGMGTVYKALHTKLGREVALKVLPAGGLGSEGAIARFEREMKAVGRLDHPHIVRALDAREVEGTRFLVLEYIEGEDLSRLVRRQGPLPVVEACQLVHQAAVGLQYAHEHELIHRDVKPSNLIVDEQGQLKILDLGLARFRPAEPTGEEMTRSGQTMGTVEYMAPEQASDTHSVDARADVYGLGCTLYYLLAGRAPYAGESAYQIIKAHHESPIPSLRAERSDVPEKLDRLFQKMVAKTPAERHASMSKVVADLDECQAEAQRLEGTAAPFKAASAGPQPGSKRRRAVALVVSALAVLVVLAGVVFRIRTPQGTLVLQVQPQDAEVVIDDGKITITTPGDPEPTEIRLKEGTHTLTVSKGGFRTHSEPVRIKSGGREVLRVTLEPLPAEAEAEPPRRRDAAEWTAILPADAPPPAVAPFDATTAKRHQRAWADYLGVPVEQEIGLPGGGKLTLVLIPPGEFLMGSPAGEQTRVLKEVEAANELLVPVVDRIRSEGPQHWVRITTPFRLSRQEITRGQFRRFVDQTGYKTEAERDGKGGLAYLNGRRVQDPRFTWSTDPGFPQTDDHPVVNVSWNDAMAFCQWLSKGQGAAYRLPSEALWEYACRAGTTTFFHCGDSDTALEEFACIRATAHGSTGPVGQFEPNGFGLHDMHGNVWEWCADWWTKDYYAESPPNDPGGSAAGLDRVVRGGAWDATGWGCRAAHRANILPQDRYYGLGFRVAVPLPPLRRPDPAEWTAILPTDAPPPALAPLDAATAKWYQQAWADYLGVPVEREIDLPGAVKLTLVLIPPGEFLMGSPAGEQTRFLKEAKAASDEWAINRIPTEGPQHWVRITKAFAMSRHEITRGQFRRFVDRTGYKTDAERDGKGGSGFVDGRWVRDPRFVWSVDPGFPQTDEHPVVNVSWNDAGAFCQWLSKEQGAACHLPTEAEWEYACRAGTTTPWHCGDSDATLEEYAWLKTNAGRETHPVGQLKPNPWGLYDVQGNLCEWCADWLAEDYYAQSPLDDPTGPATGSRRVYRGGSWGHPVELCRSARRSDDTPDYRSDGLGFRVAVVVAHK